MAYSEVCRHFRPVFRYFCMERFLDPAVWMEKRLAYTRSVATSSIGTHRSRGGVERISYYSSLSGTDSRTVLSHKNRKHDGPIFNSLIEYTILFVFYYEHSSPNLELI